MVCVRGRPACRAPPAAGSYRSRVVDYGYEPSALRGDAGPPIGTRAPITGCAAVRSIIGYADAFPLHRRRSGGGESAL